MLDFTETLSASFIVTRQESDLSVELLLHIQLLFSRLEEAWSTKKFIRLLVAGKINLCRSHSVCDGQIVTGGSL